MKTPGEGTGATRLNLSSPAWATLSAWAMSGGFPTSATEMEEVCITFLYITSASTYNKVELYITNCNAKHYTLKKKII